MSVVGIAYPLQIKSGNLLLASDEDLIKGQILSLLETRFYERVMLPGYGTPDQLFESYSDLIPSNTKLELILRKWIPVANFRVASEYSPGGEVLISIYWSIQKKSDNENLINLIW